MVGAPYSLWIQTATYWIQGWVLRSKVKYSDHGATDDPRPLASRRPGPRAPGRDHHRADPARDAPAPGGPRRALRREPHARARGAAPAPGARPRRAARPPRRARPPVLGGGVPKRLPGARRARGTGRRAGIGPAHRLRPKRHRGRPGPPANGLHPLRGARDRRRSRAGDRLRAVVTGERALPQRHPRGGLLPPASRHGPVAPERGAALDRLADVRRRSGHHPAGRPTTTTASPRRSSPATPAGPGACCTRTCSTPARPRRAGSTGRAPSVDRSAGDAGGAGDRALARQCSRSARPSRCAARG